MKKQNNTFLRHSSMCLFSLLPIIAGPVALDYCTAEKEDNVPASVTQLEGVDVFVNSRPNKGYVKLTILESNPKTCLLPAVLKALIAKTKLQCPGFEGLIFNETLSKFEVIKFLKSGGNAPFYR